MSKKIAVLGHRGRIGKLLLQMGGIPLECDITNLEEIEEAIKRTKPDVIASLASKSNVDWGEKNENMQQLLAVNAHGVNNVGIATQENQIPVVIVSTDHIFSGRSYFDFRLRRFIWRGPYKEEYSRPIPVNRYGMSKLAAETIASSYDNIKIVRTSYLFNDTRLLDARVKGIQEDFPSFIVRSFMSTQHFANSLWFYLKRISSMPEILHLSGRQNVSWYELMRDCFEIFDLGMVAKKRRRELSGYVPRPHRAGLNTDLSKTLGFMQYDYIDGLRQIRDSLQYENIKQ